MNQFEYKGYLGSVEISLEDNCMHGKIEFINDLVNYEAETVEALRLEFEAAVENYFEHCKFVGKSPDKPFEGKFDVKIGQELHEKAAIRARKLGKSLNDYIADTIKTDVESHA